MKSELALFTTDHPYLSVKSILEKIQSRLKTYRKESIEDNWKWKITVPSPVNIRVDDVSYTEEYTSSILRRKKNRTVSRFQYILEFDTKLSEDDEQIWCILITGMFLFKQII